jgi:uncharacterized protein (DUF2236 family)
MRPVIDNYADFKAYWERMHDTVLESNRTTDFALGRGGPIAAPKTLPIPIPEPLWERVIEPAASSLGRWGIAAMMSQRGRDILDLTWTPRDELIFWVTRSAVRAVWPRLPMKLRYFPRAYRAIERHGL